MNLPKIWLKYNYSDLLRMGILAALYFVAAKIGLSLAFVHPSASAVWPPTGIALAVFLILGYRFWPAIFLGAFLANLTTEGTIWTSLGIATGNTLEGLLGAFLVNNFAGGQNAFEKPGNIFRYAILAGLFATTVSATIGVASLALGGFAPWSEYLSIWFTWWIGDFGGAMIVAPLLILWSQNWRIKTDLTYNLEASLIFIVLVIASLIVFGGLGGYSPQVYPLEIFLIPILAWLAFSLSQRAVATGIFLLSFVAIAGTLGGLGPFIKDDPNQSLLALQTFLNALSITFLVMSAVVIERRSAVSDLDTRVLERKKAEENLHEAQKIAHVGSWEWDLESDKLTGSAEFYRIYGLTPDEFSKKHGGFLEYLNPHSRNAVKDSIKNATKTHKPFSFYYPITLKDGSKRILHARIKVVFDEAGQAVKVTGTAQDVTVEKQAEESLKKAMIDLEQEKFNLVESKAKEDAILTSIGEGLLVVDRKGIIQLMNKTASEMIGWKIHEAIGKSVQDIFPIYDEEGKIMAQKTRPMEKALKLKKEYSLPATKTYYFMRRDGTKFPVVITAAPVKNDEILGVVSVFRDISREKEIDRMKTEFISVAAHQLRTPLGSMRWTMEMLLNGDMGRIPAAIRKSVQTIYESNQRMITLVNDLLDVSRIDAQRVQDQPEAVDIKKVISDVVAETETEAKEKSIKLKFLIRDNVPKIMIDPKRLREAVTNFISNAIKYNVANGTILVKIERIANLVRISVSDKGMGIPKKDQAHIFSRFFRAENAIRRETSGSGLGLFVVASYVKGWGGDVGFESQEGKGSTFWFTLPLKPRQHTLDKRLMTLPVS